MGFHRAETSLSPDVHGQQQQKTLLAQVDLCRSPLEPVGTGVGDPQQVSREAFMIPQVVIYASNSWSAMQI